MVSRLYEAIGQGYRRSRRPDPRIQARLHAALGEAASVLNVGAGTGSYELADRRVVAVEPAQVMLAQRPAGAAPAVRAVAEALPFGDLAFDAALAVCTVHHWRDLRSGLAELRRVARRQVVFMNEPAVGRRLWLVDYFPEVLELPSEVHAPTVADVVAELAVASVEAVPIPANCVDGITGAYWRRPEAYLDPVVRAGMSSLAQLAPEAIERGVRRLRRDLQSGRWDARYGALRRLAAYDAGYRLVVAGVHPLRR
jgi:SAM-dependent methyltransferase